MIQNKPNNLAKLLSYALLVITIFGLIFVIIVQDIALRKMSEQIDKRDECIERLIKINDDYIESF